MTKTRRGMVFDPETLVGEFFLWLDNYIDLYGTPSYIETRNPMPPIVTDVPLRTNKYILSNHLYFVYEADDDKMADDHADSGGSAE